MLKKTIRLLTCLAIVFTMITGISLGSPKSEINAYTSDLFSSRAHYFFFMESEANNGYTENNAYRDKFTNEVEDEYKIGKTYKMGLRILIFTVSDGINAIEPGQIVYEFPDTFNASQFLDTGDLYFEEGKEIAITGTIWSTRIVNNVLQIFNQEKFDPQDKNDSKKSLVNLSVVFQPDKIQDYNFTLIGYDYKNDAADVNGGFSYNKFDLTLKPQEHVLLTSEDLNITANVEGGTLKDEKSFEYTIESLNQSLDGFILPQDTTINTEKIKTGKSVSAGFEDIVFTAEGVYTFKITQSASGVSGLKDAQPQTIKVAVLSVDDELLVQVIDPQSGGQLIFTNVYSPAAVNTGVEENTVCSLIIILMSIIGIIVIKKHHQINA